MSSRRAESQALLRRLILVTLCILVTVRLIAFVDKIALHSLQMDFAAFYTAGEAMNQGVSPYVTHIDRKPPLWDGVCRFTHSRFLYPPLAASFFQLVANASYAQAKILWMLMSIFTFGIALWLAARHARQDWTLDDILVLTTVLGLFFPLLTMLERGQVDAVTLLLMLLALECMLAGGKMSYCGGACLAVATFLKLHCAFALPFLLLRKKYGVVVGWIMGVCVLCLGSMAISGVELWREYLFYELPRIRQFGEGGTPDMQLPKEFLDAYKDLGPLCVKDGLRYQPQLFGFLYNATMVRVAGPMIEGMSSIPWSDTELSLCFLLLLLIPAALLHWRGSETHCTDRIRTELIWWQIVLTTILLSAPLTWTMNTVWMAPCIAILLSEYRRMCTTVDAAKLFILFLGVLLIGVPDHVGCWIMIPPLSTFRELLDFKYVLGEILALTALLWMVAGTKSPHGMAA